MNAEEVQIQLNCGLLAITGVFQKRLQAYKSPVFSAEEDEALREATAQLKTFQAEEVHTLETLTQHYEALSKLTKTLEENDQKTKRKRQLIEIAEQTKTILLNCILLEAMVNLDLFSEDTFKNLNQQQSILSDLFTCLLASSLLVYGSIKGYSALAGFLLAIQGYHSLAAIITSSVSAAAFFTMYAVFETRTLCNERGLTGNTRESRAQMGLQYQGFQLLTDKLQIAQNALHEKMENSEALAPEEKEKITKITAYRTALKKVQTCDLGRKTAMAES